MATTTVSTTAWTSIHTTTTDTAFQNRSPNPMYITTESTTSLDFDAGFLLNPGQAVVIATGLTVSAVTFRSSGEIFYMAVA